MTAKRKESYQQVLKSSALIGVSSAMNAVFGIIRTKALALLLGPAGIGLVGLYGSIVDLTRSIAGLGINSSGVRQIAESVGSGDTQRIARTVRTLRRIALWSGALGALMLLVFSKFISQLTFGDDQHTSAVALLALAVFFGDISAAQGALVQGMRRISDLARINILGALYGTVFCVLIVYYVGQAGLVPALVCVAGMAILTSWWYARKVKVEPVRLGWGEFLEESAGLLKLGVVFMASGLMTLGSAYFVRIMALHRFGVEGAGFYQAAWALGGFYAGFILQSMGADYYPRLTAVASDNSECNRLVNEQAEVALLLAVPGIIATLTITPLIIDMFYSTKFGPAVEIFRWICLGMLLRVASWPMGFIVLAKGEQKIFFWAELASNLILLALAWGSMELFGLKGTGIGFFGMYFLYWFVIYLIARRLSGFQWSPQNRRLALLYTPLVATVFVAWYFIPPIFMFFLGGVATLFSGLYSIKTFCVLLPVERFPKPLQKLVKFLEKIPFISLPIRHQPQFPDEEQEGELAKDANTIQQNPLWTDSN